MPVYEFEPEQGGPLEQHFFHMSEAPRCGELVEIEGRRLVRVPSVGGQTYVEPEVRFVDWTMPEVHHLRAKGVKVPHVDPKTGRPAFASKAEIDRLHGELQEKTRTSFQAHE